MAREGCQKGNKLTRVGRPSTLRESKRQAHVICTECSGIQELSIRVANEERVRERCFGSNGREGHWEGCERSNFCDSHCLNDTKNSTEISRSLSCIGCEDSERKGVVPQNVLWRRSRRRRSCRWMGACHGVEKSRTHVCARTVDF